MVALVASCPPELENCAPRGPCAMGRSVNPTFHSQMFTAVQPLHQIK